MSGSLQGNAGSSSATGGQGRGKTESKRLPPFSLMLLAAASCFFLSFYLSEVVLREKNTGQKRDAPWTGVCGVCVCVCFGGCYGLHVCVLKS